MQKSIVTAIILAFSFFSHTQTINEVPLQLTKSTAKPISTDNNSEKAAGVSLWSSDFSSSSDWTTGGNGSQGSWTIGTESDFNSFNFQGQNATLADFMNSASMTTAANGFAYFDAIQFHTNNLTQNAWIEMTNGIDCTGENEVTFQFEQEYRAFNTDFTYIEVSLDGGSTWEQTIDINANVSTNTAASATFKSNIFDVNGSADVKFRFRWEASTGSTGGGYGWQVDDIDITTLSDNDIAIENYYYGTIGQFGLLHYYQIPLEQVAPIEGAAILRNIGTNDQSNVVFTAEETVNGIYTENSSPTDLLAGESDSTVVANGFTPNSMGDYQIDYSIYFDNTDDIPANNTVDSYKFKVGESVFARDSSTQANSGIIYGQNTGANNSPADEIEIGNVFTIAQTSKLTAIEFQLGDIISEGSSVWGIVYDENLDPINNGATEAYIVESGDEKEYKTLTFNAPIDLEAGESYLITVTSDATDFSVAMAGESAPQTSFVKYLSTPSTWYYITATPIVRMNFGAAITTSKSTISGFSHLVGTPSEADSFNVMGHRLNDDITLSAPTNFEIANSLAGPYSSSLTLPNSGPTLPPTKVYVRLDGPNVNLSQAGEITLSSDGAADRKVLLEGETLDYFPHSIGEVTGVDTDGVGTSVGDYTTLTGTVHCENFTDSGYDFTLIDNLNDGINLFSITELNGYVPSEGDQLEVKGQIAQNNGLLQIKPDTITVLSQGASLQAPIEVMDLDEASENKYVKINNLILENNESEWPSDDYIEVSNGTTIFQVKVPATSAMAGTPTPTDPFSMTGIGRQLDNTSPYDSGYEIYPCGVETGCDVEANAFLTGVTITADNSDATYEWINCADSSIIPGETESSFVAEENGSYAVIVSYGACSDTSECIEITGVGLDKNDFSGVKVYPNPVQDVLKITNENGLLKSVSLYTAAGRLIYSSRINSKEHQINTSRLSSGVYFVNLKTGSGAKTYKLIK